MIFLNSLKDSLGENFLKKVEKKFFKTSGDKSIEKKKFMGNKGLFTKEIDDAQMNSEIDLAVHSLKDLPTKLPQGLLIGAVLKRDDPRDVILSLTKKKIETLSKGAIVGTSSIRRKVELKKIRPDLIIKQIRGNVETRIMKLKQGNYDAIILAAAGLRRLQVEEHFEEIDIKTITPSPGQAVIAIVIKENSEWVRVLKKINNKKTFIESNCERTYLQALDGSCETPIGALATLSENKQKILFNYMASSVDGEKYIKGKVNFELKNYKRLSFDLGTKIKQMIEK